MKVVTCKLGGRLLVGRVEGARVVLPALGGEPAPDDMLGLIDGGPALWQRFAAFGGREVALEEVELAAPIPRPRKNIVCLGWNYAEHVEESARASGRKIEKPEHPVVFTKAPTSVIGPHADIPHDPEVTAQLDWEVELGVVLGRGGRRIAREDALGHVFGYTVVNDVSARDLQFRHKQFFLGKSLDGACPMGPWIVTADEIPDPQALEIRSAVDGVEKQRSHTSRQIFDVATTLSILSRGMTLEPGDVISTGTPSGVGFAREPPEFLTAGRVVECEVERIGVLRNRVVAA